MINFLESIDRQLLLLINGWNSPFFDEVMWTISGKLTWVPLYALLLFLILSASIPGGRVRFDALLPVTAAAGAGIAVGSFIQNNKKLKKRKRKQVDITNSNHRNKFT